MAPPEIVRAKTVGIRHAQGVERAAQRAEGPRRCDPWEQMFALPVPGQPPPHHVDRAGGRGARAPALAREETALPSVLALSQPQAKFFPAQENSRLPGWREPAVPRARGQGLRGHAQQERVREQPQQRPHSPVGARACPRDQPLEERQTDELRRTRHVQTSLGHCRLCALDGRMAENRDARPGEQAAQANMRDVVSKGARASESQAPRHQSLRGRGQCLARPEAQNRACVREPATQPRLHARCARRTAAQKSGRPCCAHPVLSVAHGRQCRAKRPRSGPGPVLGTGAGPCRPRCSCCHEPRWLVGEGDPCITVHGAPRGAGRATPRDTRSAPRSTAAPRSACDRPGGTLQPAACARRERGRGGGRGAPRWYPSERLDPGLHWHVREALPLVPCTRPLVHTASHQYQQSPRRSIRARSRSRCA